MTKLVIKTGSAETFFKRGRQLAAAADRGARLPDECTLSFDDPDELVRLVTTARLALFRAVKEEPGSITQIARRLQRDRSAVKRDVDALLAAGLLTVTDKILPGHGRMKEVRAAASRFRLLAHVI